MIPRTQANYSLLDLLRATRDSWREDGRIPLKVELEQATTAKHAMFVPSARAGLYLLFKALDQPRVICPAYTCNAVIEAIRLAGKIVDYVPLASTGFNADTHAVSEKAGPDTIILMTHQFGQMEDVSVYREIAESSGAILLEDAAAAQGGYSNGAPAGSHGLAAVIGFGSGAKILHAPVNSGVICSSDDAFMAKLELLAITEFKPVGIVTITKNWLAAAIYAVLANRWLYSFFHLLNFRLRGRNSAETPLGEVRKTNLYQGETQSWQAHLLRRQLPGLEANTKRRRLLFEQLRALLSKKQNLRMPDPPRAGDACARFSFVVDIDRSIILQKCARRGLDLGISFSCIAAPEEYVVDHTIAAGIVNVPLFPQLSDRDMDHILEVLDDVLGEGAA